MFTSMRMFEEAKACAEQASSSRGAALMTSTAAGRGGAGQQVEDLMSRQAEWSEETANYEAAAEMYIRVCVHVCAGRKAGRHEAARVVSFTQC